MDKGMEPFDLVLWAFSALIASVPLAIAIAIVGITISEVIKKHRRG
jgi:hypothetical protein